MLQAISKNTENDVLYFVIQDPSKGLDTTYLWMVNTRHYAKMSSENGGKPRIIIY